jgi:hypothetical protein
MLSFIRTAAAAAATVITAALIVTSYIILLSIPILMHFLIIIILIRLLISIFIYIYIIHEILIFAIIFIFLFDSENTILTVPFLNIVKLSTGEAFEVSCALRMQPTTMRALLISIAFYIDLTVNFTFTSTVQ